MTYDGAARLVEPHQMADWVHSLGEWTVVAHHDWEWRSVAQWSASKMYERFMAKVCPDVSYFYAVERNPTDSWDSHPGHHIHALWANCDEVFRKGVWLKWFGKYGRARIEPCRSRADVAGYCAKYITKSTAWWNFRLDRQRWFELRKGVRG